MVIRHTRVLKGLGAVVLGVIAASAARADCAPVIAAFRKAEATGRFAWFKVSDPNQAPNGDVIMISMGDESYVPVEGGSRYKGKYQMTGLLNHPVNRIDELLFWNLHDTRPRLDHRLAA